MKELLKGLITGAVALSGVALLALVLDTSLPGFPEKQTILNLALIICLMLPAIYLCCWRVLNLILEKTIGGNDESEDS